MAGLMFGPADEVPIPGDVLFWKLRGNATVPDGCTLLPGELEPGVRLAYRIATEPGPIPGPPFSFGIRNFGVTVVYDRDSSKAVAELGGGRRE
jgi:hypothetical protein